ncbi:hypothetical protein [Sinosporangium siamense]|uniref:Uncharacterized protein n=1 Tax=Sinosporangium siamense TaxID=1367973 RepID=A0A919RPD5_9ACTN|nr:hypothetical protein [Sinosporangium siamense]GII95724.1 hypothetical protein Ssi02_59550 [Sinosporangium siamense]
MFRLLSTACATLTLCATVLPVSSASAATSDVVYGYAWSDGPSTLRVAPAKAKIKRVKGVAPQHELTPIARALERQIDYTDVDFRRVTAKCDLKETEGVAKVDRDGLGTTPCKAADLAFALELGPVPVRFTPPATAGGRPVIHELLTPPRDQKSAYGTLKRHNNTTVIFQRGKSSAKLGYTIVTFNRTTKGCADAWAAGTRNAGPGGLGTKLCDTRALTKTLKRSTAPVCAKVDYDPVSGQLFQIWETSRTKPACRTSR